MSRIHAKDNPTPTGMVSRVSQGISSKTLVYSHTTDQSIEGYLSTPEVITKGTPGVIVIHEWWGLNDNIRSMADQLAADGYAALAVDMYGGKSANDASEARELMSKVGKDRESALHNLRQAYAYLKDVIKSERVGVIGWCFGGGWSLQAAINFGNDLNAAVIYYGRVSSDGNDLRAIDSPLLGIFGSEDGGIPIETVRNFEAELTKLEKDITINIYKGAGHAFANPSGRNFQSEPAKDAWARTLEFFAKHLKP